MSTSVASFNENLQADVAEQLERILADEVFASSARSSRFLRYVVEQALAGRGGEIKELVIAVEIYGRGSSYDPKADSTVRVEASRLRAKLLRYYAQHGAHDPIRITIPKGTYVPQFERTSLPPLPVDEAAATQDPTDATPARAVESSASRRLVRAWTAVFIGGLAATLAWWPWSLGAVERVRRSVNGMLVAAAEADPEALAAWEEGNELLRQDPHSGQSDHGTPATLERAIDRYQVAVAKSPAFARGWASLAESYEYASAFVGRDHAADAGRAEDAARRAVALDASLADGHATLGLVLFYLRWDFAAAAAEYRRAIELDPRRAWTIVEYADLLRVTGRLEQAATLVRKARVLQPALPVLAVKEAEILLEQGRIEEALATAMAAVRLKQDSRKAHIVLGAVSEAKGDVDQALAHYRRALELNARDRHALPALGHLLGRSGRRDEARDVLRRIEELDTRVRNCAYQIAVVHMGLGDERAALSWLERAFASRQMHVPLLVVDARFRPLRKHPRFRALVDRLGLKSTN